MALLDVKDLDISITGVGKVVEGFCLTMNRGEIVGLVGESGSGKTISCRALAGLLPPMARIDCGQVLFNQSDLARDPAAARSARGRGIGMIFQTPLSFLDPVMSVGRQIAEPMRYHFELSRRDARSRAIELLRQVGIPDPARRATQYPHEYSGGMRQRAMIAMALALNPKVLLADEPTTALDVTVQAQVIRLLMDLRDSMGLAILLVSHNLSLVGQVCDAIAVMYSGKIVEYGDKQQILDGARHPYTAALLDSDPANAIPGRPLAAIPGQPPTPRDVPNGCRFRPRCAHAARPCSDGDPVLDRFTDAHASACLRRAEIWP